MHRKSIRFGVTDTRGRRAATWSFVTAKSPGKRDIYLICRELKQSLKVSFHEISENPAPHERGEWRIAYLRPFFYKNTAALSSPVIDVWPRPSEIGPGVTLAFQIITTPGAITTPIIETPRSPIEWIPSPPGSFGVVETSIVLTAPTTGTTNWPGKNSMDSQLVGLLDINDGSKAWIVYRRIPMPEIKGFDSQTRGGFFSGQSRETLRKSQNPRILVFANTDEGSRAIFEFGCEVIVGA